MKMTDNVNFKHRCYNMKFEWKNEYSLGDSNVDNEHQQLFELANLIIDSPTNEALINNIMHLYKHTREHFQAEEKLMQEQGYPAYGQHVASHNAMLALLVSKSEAIKEGLWGKNQVFEFMTQWISHVTSDDRQFRDYFASSNPV